ncbi:tRNA lysidine(34) synthetase TilS [Niallia sp. MER 6]|uniref:tRNA lysidine(34) synthetase TilS n=1 Tax=Niallia sp. MER 6 TaxID=2939567 RepID=UPI00203BD16B|nr:tRNA lysidine(34) synthetase TilS [Niallia sp. MER 6]MCM3033719.1 tRNA lysidine(34) synthetase TilS [Niallia sp. MER 6]
MLEEKVVEYLKKKDLSLSGARVLVGVSGGPDSLALLHFLWSKESAWNIKVIAAHVDHMFRGEESLEDAKFVEEFCKGKSIPFIWKQIDMPAIIKQTGKNGQLASRECRYAFYKEIMEESGISLLALGHHADDQIETILMRLTRGSSAKSRAGIPFSRPFGPGRLFRPFLCLEKQEIEEYCNRHMLFPRRDPSNDKEVYSRNRFRKHVLPFLKQENPNAAAHFQRFSEEAEEDEAFLLAATKSVWSKVVKSQRENEITVDINAFLSIAISLQRRCIHLILNYLYKEKISSLSALHTNQIIALFQNPHSSGNIDLPEGLKVIKSYHLAHFQLNISPNEPFYHEFLKSGEILLPNGHYIRVEYTSSIQTPIADAILVDPESITFPLVIRTRKNGDKIQVRGMNGMKKVKKLFIDAKIPLQERDGWPIITDGNDNILWVPGLKKSVFSLKQANSGYNLLITYKKQ